MASDRVFVLAASNLPWDLDVALLRRLEKRIYIPFPTKSARKSMLQMYFSQQRFQLDSSFDFDNIASETEGFSGADMKLVSLMRKK
jgi:katanin p60 ATPase-containing subunit A1